jgi:RNA-binding protein 39
MKGDGNIHGKERGRESRQTDIERWERKIDKRTSRHRDIKIDRKRRKENLNIHTTNIPKRQKERYRGREEERKRQRERERERDTEEERKREIERNI